MEAAAPRSRKKCPHFIKVCSVRTSANTWALSMQPADQRPKRADAGVHSTHRREALCALEPARPEELLAEQRNLLSNKPAAQGLHLLVLSQILTSLKQEPYLIHLCLFFFMPVRFLSWTGWLNETICHWISANDLKVQVNLGLHVFIVTVTSSLFEQRLCNMQSWMNTSRTVLSPRDTKYN